MRKTTRELSNDPIVDRIDELLKEQHKTQSDLIQAIGMKNGTYTRWRYGNAKTYMSHISEIADYFGVSPNYLLRGNDGELTVETLSNEEKEMILNLRRLSSEKREYVLKNVKWLVGS